MSIRKYVPLLGGLLLFVVALMASNGGVSFDYVNNALAEDPECSAQLANGACIEIIDEIPGSSSGPGQPIFHLTGGGTPNEKDYHIIKVVYHVPTAQGEELEGLPSLALYMIDGNDVIEMDRVTGDSSNGFHTDLLAFRPEGDRHDYTGYTIFAKMSDRTFANGAWQYEDVVQTANYSVTHQIMDCEDGADNDGDYEDMPSPLVGAGVDHGGGLIGQPADDNCISPYDDSEDSGTMCSNGIDDDSDGKTDYKSDGTGDPDCDSWDDQLEASLTSPSATPSASSIFSPFPSSSSTPFP